jgi:hypothetical protein
LLFPTLLLVAAIVLAGGYIGYVLWPRWPATPVSLDAPALPITVANVTFNIPPAAIRRPVQRRPGAQDRIDLVFLWPSLTPPDPAVRPQPVLSPDNADRVFATITVSDGTLPPAERIKTIYPRYLDAKTGEGPGGLASRPFRADSPYRGEELLFDPRHPDGFIASCTRDGASATLGICLYDRRIGDADVTIRFPRDWLSDWQAVADSLERLIASWHAHGG